jgi:hypothetical protein
MAKIEDGQTAGATRDIARMEIPVEYPSRMKLVERAVEKQSSDVW